MAEDWRRKAALESDLLDMVMSGLSLQLTGIELEITPWGRDLQEAGVKDVFTLDEPQPGEDRDGIYLVRRDGERFEVAISLDVISVSRKAEKTKTD
jgi:hypothetical protein